MLHITPERSLIIYILSFATDPRRWYIGGWTFNSAVIHFYHYNTIVVDDTNGINICALTKQPFVIDFGAKIKFK